jgi:steroid delta-isomerase-like uncharacterized protein
MATEAQTAAEVARRYFEAIRNRDLEAMVAMWKPGGYGHIHGMADLRAPDGYRKWFKNLFSAFPDLELTALDIVAEGDKAAVRWRATGTFNGTARFEGMRPTGARIDTEGLDLLTIRDGRIEENRAYTNAAEMARQLGALPPTGSARERLMVGSLNAVTRVRRGRR